MPNHQSDQDRAIQRLIVIFAAEIYKKAGASDSDFKAPADDFKQQLKQLLADEIRATLSDLRDWAIEYYEPNSSGYMTVVEIDDRLQQLSQPTTELNKIVQ